MRNRAHVSDLATPPAIDLPEAHKRRVSRVVLYHGPSPGPQTLAEALTRAGYEVRTAGQFQDAVAWLTLYQESVLLVVRLSAIDSFRQSVLSAVRRVTRGIPIVALAPDVTPSVEAELERAGVRSILAAVPTPAELVAAVAAAAARGGGPTDPDDGPAVADGA